MTEKENLKRWRDSGQPHVWVWGHSGVWTAHDYLNLLETLRESEFWPMNENDIEKTVEEAANLYHDLKRWRLLDDDVQDRDDGINF